MHRYHPLRGKGLLFLLLLWFIWFMNFTGRTIFSPILPLLEDEFVVSHAKASSIYLFVSAGYALSLFFSGFVSVVLGSRKAITVGLSLSALIFFIIPLVKVFSLFYVCTFGLGMTTGLYLPSVIPIITEYYDEKVWGKTIAIHDSATSFSFFCAPFIVVSVLLFMPWRGIFVLMGLAYVMGAIGFYFVCEEVQVHKRTRYFITSIFRRKSLWLMWALWIFAAAANFGVYLVIPLYLTKELFMDIGHANTIFGLSRLGGVLIAVSAGFFVDRFSLKKTMLGFMFATGILTMLLAVRTGWMEVRLFLQAAISIGFFPMSLVAASRMFDAETRAQATGFVVTGGVIFGMGLVPYLLGLAGDFISFRFGIMVLGVFTTLSSTLVYFMKELK